MALQWMILTYVVAAEAAIAVLLTLPAPKLLRNRFVSLVSLILQPALFIVPFAGFQLLGILSHFLLLFFFLSWVCSQFGPSRHGNAILRSVLDMTAIIFILGFPDDN